jgi:hypothetical protein
MEKNLALLNIIGLLADEDNFKILAAIALGNRTLTEISGKTGFENAKIVKVMVKLEKAGLIENQGESGYCYCARVLKDLNHRIGHSLEHKAAASKLDRFIRNGRLLTFPKSQEDRILVLEHLADMFEFGRKYTETEVNIILNTLHPDHAAFRRYLIDYGFLERNTETDDGHAVVVYWRKAKRQD